MLVNDFPVPYIEIFWSNENVEKSRSSYWRLQKYSNLGNYDFESYLMRIFLISYL